MRFYEGVVRLGGALPDGEDAGALGPSPVVYDVDPVVDYLSSVEDWVDPMELPGVEPPPLPGGRVLADFVMPGTTLERSEELVRDGTTARMEEWIEGVAGRPVGDVVGCVFSPAGGDGRRARLGRRPGVARVWRAVVMLAGWEPVESGGAVLREKQTYDWLLGVTEGGRFSGETELRVVGREPGGAGEREVWEHYGMTLLYPFLFAFALLSCENVGAASVQGGGFEPGPRYLRPVLEPAGDEPDAVFPAGRFESAGAGRAEWSTRGG